MIEDEAVDWNALPQKARDAILSAYLGISVLEIMCRASKLEAGRTRSRELLIEMAEAFPVLSGLSSLRNRAVLTKLSKLPIPCCQEKDNE